MTAADIIRARRRHIEDNAKCDGCGSTLAACRSQRGQDPTAPPWLGCCARGVHLLQPCRHVADPSALRMLLDEAEAGHVRTVEEAYPAPVQGPRRVTMSWLLHQGDVWQPKDRPLVRIADMDAEWRYNTAQWLERYAERLALSEQWSMAMLAAGPLGPSGDAACDAFDSAIDAMGVDPLGWLRSTPLYRALVKGLPTKRKKLARLAERARHWSTCPARADGDCTCAAGEYAQTRGGEYL